MANKKIQATATLFLDTKDAQNDAKKFVNDLKQKLSDIETAADKMTVFKDMVAYIAQVDRALAALRKNNKDAFNSMFDGLDFNLKQQLEGLFGVNGAQLGQVDALREKLNTLTLKSSIKEIRTFAKEINALFTSIGVSAPFDNINEQFSGRTNTSHIQALATSLADFATVWEDLSANVAKGFGTGGTGEAGSGVFGGLSNEVQEEIDKLKKQKEDIASIVNQIKEVSKMSVAWEDGDTIDLDFEATEEAAQKLIDRFKQLDDAINNNEFDDKSVAYAEALTERAKIALQLIEINNRLTKTDRTGKVTQSSPDFLRNFLADNEDGDNIVNYAIEDFTAEANEQLENLQQESANTTQQINELKKSIKDVFDTVGNTASVSGTFENIGDAVEDAGDKVDAFGKKVDNLNESIKRVYMSALDLEVDTRNGNASGKEFMNLFDADGVVSTTEGIDYQVDTDTLVQQLVANLNRDIVMSLHNHANGDMGFSPSDINSFAKMYYGQGTKINGIIANGFIHTIDFNSIGQEVAIQIAQDYQDGIQHLFEAKNIAQFASFENGSIVPSDLLKQAQASNPEYYQEIIDQLQEAQMTVLRQAFEKNGAEFTLQSFGLDNIDELSTYLIKVQKNTQNTIEPVEKLKNLISALRPSADLSEFTEVFDKFKNGAIDGSQALNQILDLSSVDKAKAKIEEFLALAKETSTKTFADQFNAIDNVEIGKYTQRLEEARNELLELGRQGLLTVDQLEAVDQAFNEASRHLESETRTYNTWYTGYTGDVSRDDYEAAELAAEEAQIRAENAESDALRYQEAADRLLDEKSELQRENDKLREQLATRQSSSGDHLNDDELSDIQKENGALQDKLEVLKDIADAYGVQITQRARNRYEELNDKEMESGLTPREEDRMSELSDTIDEADSNLLELEQTYDRIILKLTNGKKIEILPDDDGLRKLYKISNEYYDGEYDGIDIEDIIFERKQEQSVIEANNQALQEQLNLEKQINDEVKSDDREVIRDKDVDHVGDTAISTETAQLELLQNKLLEVKTAVDAKTQAFEEEYVTVDSVVDAEITSLQSLIAQLQEVITQINLINDDFNNINTNAPKIELKSAPVEQSGATENIHYVTDPQGRPVNAYRGIEGAYSGLVSNRYHGGTFWTTNIELAKEYAGEIGKVEKSLLSMKNPMEIDGQGAYWNQIEYIGDNSDEASQKLHELNATIRQTESFLEHLKTIQPTEKELKNLQRGFISETQNDREIREYTAALEKAKAERDAIFADSSNPYGKKNTNELVEIAKANGYDGVIFKDIIDSATGKVTDLSTVMVTFEQDQIHYLETIGSTFESAVNSLKNQFGDLIKHVSASSDEVESSIRQMVELRNKLISGDISENEYNDFISKNAIAKDFDKLVGQTINTPDFINKALNGEEFYLNDVIADINNFVKNMRDRLQKVAQTFGKDNIPLDDLLATTTEKVETTGEKLNVSDELDELDKLQAALAEVKNAILAKTKAFIDEGNTVGQVIGKEVAALKKLSEIVDGITPKVNSLVGNLKNIDIAKLGAVTQEVDENVNAGTQNAPATDPFKIKLSNQTNAFTKYRNDIKDADYLTEDLEKQIDSLGISLREVSDQPGLDAWIKRFVNLKENVQVVKSEFEQMNLGTVNLFQRELSNSFNKLTLPQKEDMLKEYLQAIVLLNRQKQAVEEGHAVEVKAVKEITAELQKKINAQIEANKVAKDAEKVQKKNGNFGSTASINATAKYNSLIEKASNKQFANSSTIAAALMDYEEAYRRMIKTRDELRSKDFVDDSDKEEFKRLTTECNKASSALEKLIKNTMKLKGEAVNENPYLLGSDFKDDKDGRVSELTNFVQGIKGADLATLQFKDNWNEVVFAVDNGDGTFTQMTATFTDARNEIIALAGDTKKVQGKFESFIDGVKNRLQSLSQYFIATIGIYDVWNVIKQGIQYVREIDSALTELKKVTDATETSYNNFLQTASKTAATLGSTVSDFVDATADFARLGYDLNQASQLAEAASVYKNVGDGIDDIATASESIISTMKAFGIEANDAMGIVDRFNEVGNNFAISSTGIGEAMQRSASALYEAGNTIDESIALITGANSVIQNPEQVGTALKTLALRLRGAKVELEEAGEDVEGMAESTSQLQAKLLALTHGKVDIMLDENTFKNTTQILREMAGAWEEMTDIERASALELMGGKRQANILASVIKNFDTVEDVIATSMDSSGSAIAENEKYLDSIQGKIDLFNNSLQTMWMNFIDSKTVKNIVSLGTALIKLVDAIGLIPTGVGLFAGWKFAAAELEKAFGKTNVSTKELKKNINDYINQQKVAGQTATAAAQEVVVAEQQKTAAQTQATAAGAAEEAQDKKNIATDLAGSAADKVKAESQKEENQTQIDGVAAGKAEENQDKKNIATDLAGAGADVGAGANVKDIIKAGSSTVGVLGKIGTGIKAVGIALGKAAIVMLAVKAATWAIGEAWEALDKNVIHRAEHIKEEVKSLQDSYESMKETLDSNLKTLTTSSDTNVYKTLEDEFAELIKGVDQYGNNLSLTAEQYERYKSICEDIVGINPYLASGYDSATAAIGNQADALSHLIDLYKEQAKYEAQQFTSDENLSKVYENAKNEYQEVLSKKEDVFFNSEDAARTAQYIMDSITGVWNGTEKQFTSSTLGINNILDALGITDIDTTDVVGFGTTLDALTYLIANHSDQFIEALNNASDGTTKAYDDYVLTLDGNKISAASIALQGAVNNYQTNVDAASKKVETANDGLIYTLSQLFTASSEYDDLNDASKSFLANWLRNSDLFKVDSNLSIAEMKDKINDMITNLSVSVDAQKILDSIFAIDASKVDYEKYKTQISDLIDQFWMAIGGDSNQLGFKNKQDLAIQLGFNFTFDRSNGSGQTDEGSLVRDLSRVVGENISDVQKWIDSQPAATIQALMRIDWTTEAGLTYDEVLEKIRATIPKNGLVVDTYSVLVSEIESYNEILEQTSEIVSDNTEVTQEYKDSLTALGASEEELSECFDENNGLIVKNATALRRLVTEKKKDKQATVQQIKSMSQLQYKNTVQQLQQVVRAMAVEVRASGFVSSAALKTAESLREQLDALKQTIQQYALLEISLSDAANAYSEFEAAKERDAQLTYGDSMIEMLQTINEGFKTGQVGTEAFEYAVKVIVPESEYAHIDNIEQRMIAIHDYIDKNPLFADWFTIDEGEFSITLDNINSFIDDAFGAGLFTNDSSGDFFLTEAIKNAQDPLKEFADQLGKAFNTEVTEGSVLAMLSELEKYDASWGNILTDLTTTPIDRAINDATDALEEALTAQEEFIRSGGDLNSDKYIELEEAVSAARGALDKASQTAIDNAQTYTQVEAVLKGMTGEVKYTQEQADALARSLGLINENGHIQIDTETGALLLAEEQLDTLNERLTGLTEPTILDVQLAYDEIDRQLQELNAYLSDPSNYSGTILTELSIANENEAKAKVEELTADRDAIQLVYNITTTSTEEAGTLEKLTTWEANGVQIVISGDASAFDATVGEVNAVEMEEKPVSITADPTEANANIDSVDKNNIADKKPGIYMQGVSVALNNIDSIDDALDALPITKNIYVNVHRTESGAVRANGTAHVDGTAYSDGNWGAPRTEVALTGELGPEMVVRDGRWFTVGENGAEFTQIKKGDIIFNHKQTEDLLSKGYITSRGKAYANGTTPHTTSGTAYYKTFGGYVGDDDVFENGSNNWMDPWTNSFSDAADSMSDAADSMSDTAEQVVDFIEMKLEEIEEIIENTTASIENFLDDTTSIKSKDELYDELVKAEKAKSEAYLKAVQKYNVQAAAALSGVPQKYQEMARNGAIAIEDFIGEDQGKIADAIQEYRDWAAKADDAENGHLEAIAAISAHRVEQLEDIATDFENIISISKSHSDLLQSEMDFIEESGNRLSEDYYEELKKHSQRQLDDMQDERVALQKILDDSVAAGDVVIGTDDWYSMLETIYQVDQEIIDCKTSLEEFQNAINDLYWDNFDKLITEIDNVNSELSNLYDLVSDTDDIVDDAGNWTDDGITALGLLAQQMENAQFKTQQYGEAIEKLKKDYADGLYSTDEYNERLSDLTDSQYDAIKSYEDAKDAIVDLNKTRVDAVKDGLQKEIDAYSELIEKKKESLNSDKDAYEVQKQIQEYNENIKDIERKIASLEGNTSSSAMAQRKRLEAELLKAREELQDYYYDHSIDKQQEALDKELEGYTQNKEDQMDALDEYLKKEEQVIADSFDLVAKNTEIIVGTLTRISEEYGVTISDTIAAPWIKGTNAIGTYEEQLNTSVSATTTNLETLKQHLEDLQMQADKTAESIVNATHSTIVQTNDGHQTSIKGYAKGSKSVEYDQWALIDELGDELQLVPNKAGRLDYIKKGTGILNNTLTEKLIDLAVDPTSMLENSRPAIGAPGITTTNNTFAIDASVGTLLHVEHLDGSNPAEVAKLVDNAWEKKMQMLNNSIKKFTR